MLILADENIPSAVVSWLRDRGNDVSWVAELSPGAGDEFVIGLAAEQQRIVLTQDVDSGHIVFRDRRRCSGVILVRIRADSPAVLVNALSAAWDRIEESVAGHFVVVSRTRIRVRPIPTP